MHDAYGRTVEFGLIVGIAEALREEFGGDIDDHPGGPGNEAGQVNRAYRAAGHDVTMISRQYKNFADEEVVDGIRHLRVPSFDRSSSLAINLLRLKHSRRHLPPTIIHRRLEPRL